MKITITGVPPYDGEYPLDMSRLRNRDIATIKRVSGYAPLEYSQVQTRGDITFFVALAVIALQRAGQMVNEEALWDAEAGAIGIKLEDSDLAEAGVADPPPVPAGGAPNGTSTPSGEVSKPASERHQDPTQSFSGIH